MFLRPHLKLQRRYQVGDVIPVKVIEHIEGKTWIVSCEGDLIRVQNTSPQTLHEGDVISMRLVSLDPPRLVVV